MNKKIIFIFSLTVIALIGLYLFSFGSLANIRKTAQVNPSSSKPYATTPTQIQNQTVQLNAYHNKDVAENYYGTQFPADWNVKADQPGSYSLNFSDGTGKVYLQDVVDNTTLELFVLSQDEPQLKKNLTGYQRINYQKNSIGGNQAYQLTYKSLVNNQPFQTIQTYITGPDHAGVISLSSAQAQFAKLAPLFEKVVDSFAWENGK